MLHHGWIQRWCDIPTSLWYFWWHYSQRLCYLLVFQVTGMFAFWVFLHILTPKWIKTYERKKFKNLLVSLNGAFSETGSGFHKFSMHCYFNSSFCCSWKIRIGITLQVLCLYIYNWYGKAKEMEIWSELHFQIHKDPMFSQDASLSRWNLLEPAVIIFLISLSLVCLLYLAPLKKYHWKSQVT